MKSFGEHELPVLILALYSKRYTFLHHKPGSVDWLYWTQESRPIFSSGAERVTKMTEFSPVILQGLGSVELEAERKCQAPNNDSLPMTFLKVAERQLCWGQIRGFSTWCPVSVWEVRMTSVGVVSFGEALAKAFRDFPWEPGNRKVAIMASTPSLYYFFAWNGSYSIIHGSASSLPPTCTLWAGDFFVSLFIFNTQLMIEPMS